MKTITYDFIIPSGLVVVKPRVILIQIPYCDKNEVASKRFIEKRNKFTNDKYDVRMKQLTRKMKVLFKLKDWYIHLPCKIYKGMYLWRNIH